MPGSFFDSNTLLYLVSGDDAKADQAERLVAGGGTISVQVLNEVANVARRKLGLTWPETHELLATLRDLLIVHPVSIDTHDLGLGLAQRHQFPLYDAMIVAAALQAGCDTLWTEDLHTGITVQGRLRIANPFKP